MALLSLLSFLSLLSSVMLITSHSLLPARQVYSDVIPCITSPPPPSLLAASAELKALDLASNPALLVRGGKKEKPLKIDTYIHILAKNKTAVGGWLSKKDINTQIDAIKASYVNTNIKIDIKDVTWNLHSNFTLGENFEAYLPLKKRIRRGGYNALNLYFPWVLAEDFPRGKGFCNFPADIVKGSDEFYNDGCMIDQSMLPGRPYHVQFTNETYLQKGLTAAHEIGHWFGLIHTFGDEIVGGEGTGTMFNCTGVGDYIADTPAQGRQSGGCTEQWEFLRDTCPDQPGLDPWENHMNYAFDPCKNVENGFTPLQKKRMKEMYKRYRA